MDMPAMISAPSGWTTDSSVCIGITGSFISKGVVGSFYA